MKVVGLTGGIGSGKTTVAKMFEQLGVPLYIADDQAKVLMNTSADIKRELITLFGEEAYKDGQLNRPFIASLIFEDKMLLTKMNGIVHPQVAKDFELWKNQQTAPYVLKEVAIIFENQTSSQYDYIITVTADLDKRIQRVIHRDNTSESKIMAIVKNQWTDAEKVANSDFVITNDDLQATRSQVQEIHQILLKKTA